MRIEGELAPFITGPVMIIIGTRNAANRPSIGRGTAVRVVDGENVDLVLSSWQWPETVANLRDNGRMAVTFARPSDYVSYQLKGRATLRDADQNDLDQSRRYTMDISVVFDGLGLPREILRPWLCDRKAVVARLRVEEIYVQTPGSKAGTAIGAVT